MEARQARCWAEIDCTALVSNLAELPVEPTGVMAVVKADAYGHGVLLIAPALLAEGVRSFAVATVDEGRKLRETAGFEQAGDVDIYLMTSVLPEEAESIIAYKLIPFVTDWLLASAVSDIAAEHGIVAPVHIEVDTGIGRAGVAPADFANFYRACRALPGVQVTGVCTHFTAADDARGPADALNQHALFVELLSSIDEDYLAGLTLHAANSPAILRLPDARRHLIRPGLLLYGIGPSVEMETENDKPFRYRPVLTLKARVMLVRRLPAGTDISYGRTFRLSRDATIATVGIGYGDGYPRRLSNCGAVLLPGGDYAPIRGRVCMDQLCVELPEGADVEAGDTVTLIGGDCNSPVRVNALATLIDATPHELTTCLTARVPRISVRAPGD